MTTAFCRRLVFVALLALALAPLARPVPAAAAGRGPVRLVVSPSGPYTTVPAALADAQPGDTIEVRAGTYAGPVVITTANLTLEGVDWPVIDNGGQGTVVELAAAGVTFRGFEVRGSGVEPDRNHSGITLTAPGITVENNRLRDVLFGIFIAEADDAVVRGNDITGKAEYDLGRKGDGIRVWYSQRALIEANTLREVRDLVAWYAAGLVLRENVIAGGRYGIHLMYCDGAQIERNTFTGNSVGIYTMYSVQVTVRDNDLRGQRGPSGYALGFKDADEILVAGNVLADNQAGIFLDGTPFSPAGFARFDDNVIALNDVGVVMLPAVRGASFTGNTFWENVEQVAVQGGGLLGTNEWHGNYWSDYTGFDADGDGVGDVAYRAERFFEGLTNREPLLRAMLYSPAVNAIELAAAAFPVVRPEPKLTDPAPLAAPRDLPVWAANPQRADGAFRPAALALLLLSLLLGAASRAPGVSSMRKRDSVGQAPRPVDRSADVTVEVAGAGKRYGAVRALEGVTFQATTGEAVALWGANGAGKSTLLKAMLGLIRFDGQIRIAGHDVARAGKLARRHIGYVPQETEFYDLSVQASMEFYARLKQVSADRIPPLLDRLGLAEHARKPVPALSGGLKQRLALAVALLADPAILLLDEPTASLDARAQHDYLALLAALRTEEHKTILFASHRLEEVEALANRVLVLEHGKLVEVLKPVELLTKLMPEIELTLWVPEAQRPEALGCLTNAGWPAHFNGRGTVVVRVRAEDKMRPLQMLQAQGITIEDFEVARGAQWN